MLDKTYRPGEVEPRVYEAWESAGVFASNPQSPAKPFAIMMPPPNVTGSLHMGHALDMTLQDVLVRYHRMQGDDVLWQPGTDHAGIATQMVVERELARDGIDREQLGRDKFVERVWAWKAYSGGEITRQLRRLGCSPDWSRERFTLDEGLSRAVARVFVRLHRDGLIYRAKRLVNWDPKLHTAISDLEVQQKELQGQLFYLRYPIAGQPSSYVVIATTRPETMFGDVAVAVHPNDPRHAGLVGSQLCLPLTDRLIPVIADEHADPDMGSGAVKITPAHDFNDFEVGRRHGLDALSIIDRDGCLNRNVPKEFQGMNHTEARHLVVKKLEAAGLVERVDAHVYRVPHGDRSGVPVEPLLTDQWYCDAASLAKSAIAAVEEGRTQFVPKHWEKTFFDWMHNIQPWCISRQLWWGHRIPVWYGPDGRVFVAESEEEAVAEALSYYGETLALERDSDVLDTWFSSALWPFSTLGWPDNTEYLERYYPGNVLVTGFDIIFFWVARMMMMGLYCMKDVPFRTVYIHPLVRDEHGQKMSKSKGNVIDPLQIVDTYGADALRFTMVALAVQGRDVKVSTARVEGYRNFVTKIWNAARYGQMNACGVVADFDPASLARPVNRWIIGELMRTTGRVAAALEEYRFSDAAQALYQFVWGSLCDWYIELIKPVLQGEGGPEQDEARATFGWVFGRALCLLHPIMPFVTQALSDHFPVGLMEGGQGRAGWLWPTMLPGWQDEGADDEINWLVHMISTVRSVRSVLNVPPAAIIPFHLSDAAPQNRQRLGQWGASLTRLARVSIQEPRAEPAVAGSVRVACGSDTLVLSLAGIVDVASERNRLNKEIARLATDLNRLDDKLANVDFLARAPEEVIDEQRNRRLALAEAVDRMRVTQAQLACDGA